MPAPDHTTRSAHGHRVSSVEAGPLRLRMAEPPTAGSLDGGWWPRGRDLARELPDLVDHFPAERLGRIVRVLVSPPDWDTPPRHVLVRGGYVKVGTFAEGESSHLVHLTTTDRTLLHVLVVPPSFAHAEGDRALRAASASHRGDSADAVLERASWRPSGDPGEERSSRAR